MLGPAVFHHCCRQRRIILPYKCMFPGFPKLARCKNSCFFIGQEDSTRATMSVMAIRNLLLACDNGNCTCQPEGKYVAMCIWHCNKGCSKRNIVDVGKIPTPDFYHYKPTVCKISRFFWILLDIDIAC